MSLQNLLQNKTLEQINTTPTDARQQLDKAFKIFNFAKKNLTETGDEDIIYNHIYDSLRLACVALLFLNGYRVKTSSPGHHRLTVEAASLLLDEKHLNEFERIQHMRKKRNKFEYGNYVPVSRTELEQGMRDAFALLELVDKLIKEKESRFPIS